MLDTRSVYFQTCSLSVLFVEDHDELRMRTAEMLTDFFACVDEASDGWEGLEKYKSFYQARGHYYDLVISDIQMPRLDGIALTAELYAINETQPIIILSAHQETEYLIALINFGVAQFITKPIQYETLLQTLYSVCKKINHKPVAVSKHLVKLGMKTVWDRHKSVLSYGDDRIELTKYELILMEILADKFEQVCSTDEILNHFFLNDIDLSAENIRSMVARLRRKLPVQGCISSVYGLGYKLSTAL